MGKVFNVPSPLPQQPDKFTYWLLAAVGGALCGGIIFNTLSKKDPL